MARLAFAAVVAAAALFAGCAAFPSHVYGVDVSVPVSDSEWSCLNDANLTFAVVRCWHSYGAPDTNVVPTVAAAWSAGINSVDVYMFPCPKCGDGGGQVSKAVTYLKSNNVKFGKFWFDIEGGSTYWSDTATNVAFFEAMLQEAQSLGLNVGVYTSDSQWVPIMGSYSGGADLPLWYAHYDGQPSFSDFSPFNGWTEPFMKQFSESGSKCGVSYDINWFPPGSHSGSGSGSGNHPTPTPNPPGPSGSGSGSNNPTPTSGPPGPSGSGSGSNNPTPTPGPPGPSGSGSSPSSGSGSNGPSPSSGSGSNGPSPSSGSGSADVNAPVAFE